MVGVRQWTGREASALRAALRMSNGWPSVSLAALASEPSAVEGILSAIQQLVNGQESSA
nr:hypothetical protein OG999_22895 [Streptomyces sp. NBC_00886]